MKIWGFKTVRDGITADVFRYNIAKLRRNGCYNITAVGNQIAGEGQLEILSGLGMWSRKDNNVLIAGEILYRTTQVDSGLF
mgnify:CR=1 FL=1